MLPVIAPLQLLLLLLLVVLVFLPNIVLQFNLFPAAMSPAIVPAPVEEEEKEEELGVFPGISATKLLDPLR